MREMSMVRAIWVVILLLTAACNRNSDTIPDDTAVTETKSPEIDDWIKVYFSEPVAKPATSYRGGPDAKLAEAIDGARLTVEVAIYNMNLWSIRNALLEAHARGVVVRVVTDSDCIGGEEFQDLIEAGIRVLGDRHESSMHNKFVVIDRNEVWTGSMNFTLNGAYEDNNNLISIKSPDIAENYLTEFNEMFDEDLFSNESPANTPHPVVEIEGTLVETYFSPDDTVEERLVEILLGAEKSIHFLAYSLTADALGEAIRVKALDGVNVVGVMESEQALHNDGSEFDAFQLAALDVRLDGIEGQMHHKVIIIDEKIVVTGSYNFSRNASEFNDENVVIVHSEGLGVLFEEEFLRILEAATIP